MEKFQYNSKLKIKKLLSNVGTNACLKKSSIKICSKDSRTRDRYENIHDNRLRKVVVEDQNNFKESVTDFSGANSCTLNRVDSCAK